MADPFTGRLHPFVKGDDETVLVNIDSDNNETPVVITGRTYVASLGTASTSGAGYTVVATGSCAVTGASGLVTITFTDTQTDALVAGTTYYLDLVETASSAESTLIVSPVQCIARVTA